MEREIRDSLLIIMDPWAIQPDIDSDELQKEIDAYNYRFSEIIVRETKDIKHKCISLAEQHIRCPLYDDWLNLPDVTTMLDYIDKKGYTSLIYAGFHHGRCIVHKATGAKNLSTYVKCYLWKDLACVYPKEYKTEQELDHISQQFMEYI